ncbi:MAG: hypothetical protein L6Q37_02235 [Bdellovibrionaceae bacterium]|nr:hypothetical protein [Pseudobdellovibrionaceae bacterium]NUM59992.1 hypothetical protein [Pseudobdellovibrionaceae bacterium]
MKKLRIFSYLILFFLVSKKAIGVTQLSSEALEVKNKLELEIQKSLYNLISTQLSPESFSLGVRIQLTTLKPPAPNETKKAEDLPIGMDLGAIDVRELVSSYEKQIEELKLKKDEKKDEKNQFQLSLIEVTAGLDESYGDAYIGKFKVWLQNKMKAEYGSVVKTTVNKLNLKKLSPKEEEKLKDKPEEKPEVKEPTLWDKIKDFIPIMMALILALSLLLFGRTIKNGLYQIASAQKTLTLESKSEWLIGGGKNADKLLGLGNGKNPEDANQVKRIAYATDEFERITGKIAFVCLELGDRLNELVRVWIDSGDEGFIKTALLIDTIVNARERIMSKTGAIAPIKIPLDEQLVKMSDENLSEAYNQVSNMPPQDKVEVLDKIYWDLVSFKTLGIQSLRKPFDFLQSLPKENIIELLSTQKKEAQALALIYLPKETKTEILNEFPEEKRTEMLKNMLIQSQFSQKEIWDIDMSVKVASLNNTLGPVDKMVNVFPRTLEVLQTLDQVSEIRILRQIVNQLPDQGVALKAQYTTFSFIDEWKADYVRKLAQQATGDEILTLVRLIPEAKEIILSECPPKIKMIVEDDLKLNTKVDNANLNKKLNSLKSKWNKLLVSENIPFSKVIKPKETKEVKSAA